MRGPRPSSGPCLLPSACARPLGGADLRGLNGIFSGSGWFLAPRGYVGQPGKPTGHFTVWAAPPAKIREGYVGCPDGRRSGGAHVRTATMEWVTCPSGSTLDSDHVLLQWSRRHWRYALSLHSDTPTNRGLLRAIAGILTTSD